MEIEERLVRLFPARSQMAARYRYRQVRGRLEARDVVGSTASFRKAGGLLMQVQTRACIHIFLRNAAIKSKPLSHCQTVQTPYGTTETREYICMNAVYLTTRDKAHSFYQSTMAVLRMVTRACSKPILLTPRS